MRVRAKGGKADTEYEVLDIGEWYYVARTAVPFLSNVVALPKADYEPVPETRWVADSKTDLNLVMYPNGRLAEGYRLRRAIGRRNQTGEEIAVYILERETC